MPRIPVPTWFFALVVIHKEDKFLLVQEKKHNQTWYLPAGRIEAGESLLHGACREVHEEAGIPVNLKGIIQLEHTPYPDGTARFRIVLLGSPADDTPPKKNPDGHSLQAAWYSLAQMEKLELRGPEVLNYCSFIQQGGKAVPLTLLGEEGFMNRQAGDEEIY